MTRVAIRRGGRLVVQVGTKQALVHEDVDAVEMAMRYARREFCGRLGRGKPGRRARRLANKDRLTHVPVKKWARMSSEGRAWLERKRRAS